MHVRVVVVMSSPLGPVAAVLTAAEFADKIQGQDAAEGCVLEVVARPLSDLNDYFTVSRLRRMDRGMSACVEDVDARHGRTAPVCACIVLHGHACPQVLQRLPDNVASTAHGVQLRKYVTLYLKATSFPPDGRADPPINPAPQQGVIRATVLDLQRPIGLLLALAAALWLGMDASPAAGACMVP